MRLFVKVLLILILALLVAFVSFYYWAGMRTLGQDEYASLVRGTPAEASADTFTVMTYNIGYLSGMTNNRPTEQDEAFYRANLAAATRMLEAERPDVVAFQEIDLGARRSYDVDQAAALADALGYSARAVAVNWDARYVPFPGMSPGTHFGRMLSGQAVLSRFPIRSHERIVLERPETVEIGGLGPFSGLAERFYLDRLAQVVLLELPRPVYLINVHLEAFDRPTRERQARRLAELYRGLSAKHPTILTGDFNALLPYMREHTDLPAHERDEMLADRSLETILESGVREAFGDSARPDPRAVFTFDSERPYQKIDHLFYSPDAFDVIDARVVDGPEQPSDHRAVVVRLAFRPQAQVSPARAAPGQAGVRARVRN